MNTPRTVLLKVFRTDPADPAPALRRVPGAGRAAHHRAGRPAGRPPTQGPRPDRPALLPARLLRHLRDAGQRPRGPGLCDPPPGAGRPGGRRAPGRRSGGRRPGRGHGAALPATGAGRPPPAPGQRACRTGPRRGGRGSRDRSRAGGAGTLRGLHRVRPVPVGLPGRRRPPLSGTGRPGRRRAGAGGAPREPTGGRCSVWSTTRTAPGAATWRSSARRSARPGSTRAGRSCACAGGCSPTGCQGWSAGITRRCRHDAGGSAPGGQAAAGAALARSARAAPGHLGVRGQPAHRSWGWSATCTCIW